MNEYAKTFILVAILAIISGVFATYDIDGMAGVFGILSFLSLLIGPWIFGS